MERYIEYLKETNQGVFAIFLPARKFFDDDAIFMSLNINKLYLSINIDPNPINGYRIRPLVYIEC
jgi:hypothetical protein